MAVVETRVEMLVDCLRLLWARPQVRWSLQPFVVVLLCGPCLVVELVGVEWMVMVGWERSGKVNLGRSCRVVCRPLDSDSCPPPDFQRKQHNFPAPGAP